MRASAARDHARNLAEAARQRAEHQAANANKATPAERDAIIARIKANLPTPPRGRDHHPNPYDRSPKAWHH